MAQRTHDTDLLFKALAEPSRRTLLDLLSRARRPHPSELRAPRHYAARQRSGAAPGGCSRRRICSLPCEAAAKTCCTCSSGVRCTRATSGGAKFAKPRLEALSDLQTTLGECQMARSTFVYVARHSHDATPFVEFDRPCAAHCGVISVGEFARGPPRSSECTPVIGRMNEERFDRRWSGPEPDGQIAIIDCKPKSHLQWRRELLRRWRRDPLAEPMWVASTARRKTATRSPHRIESDGNVVKLTITHAFE